MRGILRGNRLLPGFLLVALVFHAGAKARGQMPTAVDNTPGITVYGTGEVMASPNAVEIDLRVSASAELTGDALVKYRDARRRSLEAVEKLKLKDLTIDKTDVSIANVDPSAQSRYYWGGMPATNTKMKAEIGTSLRLKLQNADKLTEDQLLDTVGKLMDVAKDAGANSGPSASEQFEAMRYGRSTSGMGIRFVLEKLAEQRDQAYQTAVNDARQRAERLAKLTGVKLGPVVAVQEVESPSSSNMQFNPYYGMMMGGSKEENAEKLISEKFGKIPVRVRLLVRFQIAGAVEPKVGAQVTPTTTVVRGEQP